MKLFWDVTVKITDCEELISNCLVWGFLDSSAGDRAENPDAAASMVPEELKWASRTEKMTSSGRERQTDGSASSLRPPPNPQKPQEEGQELLPTCSSLAPPSGQDSEEHKAEMDENHFSKSHSGQCSQIQPVGNTGQLHGVTPIKLCRKELRQISALELSLRRSALAVGVRSMTADSIEVARKSSDLKT